MKKWTMRGRGFLLMACSGGMLVLGGCGLSDQQLTGIMSSVITSGLTSLVSVFVSSLGTALTGAGA